MLRYFLPLTTYPYNGRSVPCPVCYSAHHTMISNLDRRLKRLPTALCDECGTFYTNPMPTEPELEKYYTTQYRLDYQGAFFRPKDKHVAKKQKEAVWRRQIIETHSPKRQLRTLDFGCGSGELVRELANAGHIAVGFEPGKAYSTFAASSADHAGSIGTYRIDQGPWRSMPYEAGSFDVISILHVLEHLSDPVAALKKAENWLKPDGLLYIEVPDMQFPALKGFKQFHFAHVIGFSRDNFLFAARKAGFELLEEMAPTSFLMHKADMLHGKTPAEIDLKNTAVKNYRDYKKGIGFGEFLKYSTRRIIDKRRQRI
jgi:SAM-dependent methyltransferase